MRLRAPLALSVALVSSLAAAQAPPAPDRVLVAQQLLARALAPGDRSRAIGGADVQASLEGWDGCRARVVRRSVRAGRVAIARFVVDMARLDPDRCVARDGAIACPERDGRELGPVATRSAVHALDLRAGLPEWDRALDAVAPRDEPLGAALELGPAAPGADDARLLASIRTVIGGCGGGRASAP